MKVNEIFCSIDGEVNQRGQGAMTTFIRFSGCNLTCPYCDVLLDNCQEMSCQDILSEVSKYPGRNITITGGEPLLQNWDSLKYLIEQLYSEEYDISIETNGTIHPPPWINIFCSLVMDYKSPESFFIDLDSLSCHQNHYIKFVIENEKQYSIAKEKAREIHDKYPLNIAFSPVHGVLEAKDLFFWILRDSLYFVVLNIQIHKYIKLS